jgi:hypothetical protein
MSATGPSTGHSSVYRFFVPGEADSGTDVKEIERLELDGDDAAEEHARSLPQAKEFPVVVERQGHVDWEYVTEVDERP